MIIVTPGYHDDLKNNSLKRIDFWHLVLLRENVLFKESSPNIMVIRNPNCSTKILWFGTG
jgi:hypothetical protein